MSRKFWVLIAVGSLVLLLAAGGTVAGYFYLKDMRLQKALATADTLFEEGNWEEAKAYYGHYLSQHPDYTPALQNFADASARILSNRRAALREAALAYYRIASVEPERRDIIDTLLDIHERRRAWGDLEYFANLFLEDYLDDPHLRYYRGIALERMGRTEDAIAVYRELADFDTEYYEVYGNLARILYGQGYQNRALQVFDEALARRPGHPQILLQRAQFYLEDRQFPLARHDFERAQAAAPEIAETIEMATRFALSDENWEEAVALAKKELALNPGGSEAYYGLLAGYERGGQIDKAIALLEEMDPYLRADYPEFFVIQTELLIRAQRFEEADQVLEQYRDTVPDHQTMFQYLEARALLERGNATKAATKLTTVVESAPDFKRALYFLAIAHIRAQDRAKARSELESYIRANPNDTQARRLFEAEFGANGTPQYSERAANDLLENEDVPVSVLTETARAFYGMAVRENALTEKLPLIENLLRKAIAKTPELAGPYLLLTEVHLAAGHAQEAAAILDEAREHGVSESQIRLAQAGIALANGDSPGARKVFDDALAEASLTVDQVVRWANFFAIADSLDSAIGLLGAASEHAENEEDGLTLSRERISLCTRTGNFDRALALLAKFDSESHTDEETDTFLNDKKEELALAFLAPGPGKDIGAAKRLIEEIRRSEPESVRATLLHAQALVRMDPPQIAEAKAIVEPLLNTGPPDLDVATTLAEISLRDNDSLGALTYARKVATSDPENPEAQLFLGRMYMLREQFIEAHEPLENALVANPDDTQAMELLVEAYTATGRYHQADDMLARLESTADRIGAPADSANVLRGRLMIAKGENLNDVENYLRSTYSANPGNVRALSDLVNVLKKQGRGAEAEALLRESTQRGLAGADAWVRLGQFYLVDGKADEHSKASSSLTRALVLEKDYAPALRNLITLHMNMNNVQAALGLCKRYLELVPGDPEILYRTALLLAQNEDSRSEALTLIDKALAIDLQPQYHYLRASLYLDAKRYQEALDDLHRVTRDQTANAADFDLALAEAYWGTNQPDLARQYVDAVQQRLADGGRVNRDRLDRLRRLLDEGSENI